MDFVDAGYSEDPAGHQHFERKWLLPTLGPVGLFVVVIGLTLMGKMSLVTGLLFGVSLLVACGFFLFLKHRSQPRSRHTGELLTISENSDPEWPVTSERFYACDSRKTFFSSVVSEDPDNRKPR